MNARHSAALLFLLAMPVLAAAQTGGGGRVRFTAGAIGAQQIVQSHSDTGDIRFTGLVYGGEGNLVTEHFLVRMRYLQGHVSGTADTGLFRQSAAIGRDVVEGELLLGLRPTTWLTLWAGPTARAYTTSDGDQRWLLWTGRASARGTLFPERMQSYVELWGALSGSVGNPAIKAGGRGADVGLELRLSSEAAWWGRFGYRIESSHADALRETVESLTLSVFYGLPQ